VTVGRRSKNYVARPSDVPAGLRIDPTDRGFTCTVLATSNSRVVASGAMAVGALVAGGTALAAITAVAEPVLAAVVVIPALAGALILVAVSTAARRGRESGRDKLVLDGPRLDFHSVEGPVRLTLDAVKGVDVVPVGLAVRPRRGRAVHLPLPGVDEAGRTWLRDRLKEAVDRHGRPDDVPAELQALAARPPRRTTETA
jgi:hypothetical protein